MALPGAEPFTTLDSLVARFLETGFQIGRALTLKEIRKSYIEPEELTRYVFYSSILRETKRME